MAIVYHYLYDALPEMAVLVLSPRRSLRGCRSSIIISKIMVIWLRMAIAWPQGHRPRYPVKVRHRDVVLWVHPLAAVEEDIVSQILLLMPEKPPLCIGHPKLIIINEETNELFWENLSLQIPLLTLKFGKNPNSLHSSNNNNISILQFPRPLLWWCQ